MLIYNSKIFEMIADLWNAKARVEGEREQAWCAEAVRAELRANGESPDNALSEAVQAITHTVVKMMERLERFDDGDDDEEYDDGEESEEDDDSEPKWWFISKDGTEINSNNWRELLHSKKVEE